MTTYTGSRTGARLPDDVTREPVKPPGDALDPMTPVHPDRSAGPSSVAVIIAAFALVAIVFFFMSMGADRPATSPPAQQTSENVNPPAPEPVPPVQPTEPEQTTNQ